jgi:hypothetical protein
MRDAALGGRPVALAVSQRECGWEELEAWSLVIV